MTQDISIDYDKNINRVVMTGSIGVIYETPAIAIFLRNNGAIRTSGTEVQIPIPEHLLHRKYRSLCELLGRIGITPVEDINLSESIRRIQRDELDFSYFSGKALEIWKADFDSEEFRQFTHTITDCCPGRTLYKLQLLAAYHLAFSQNACNFSVPGAGKTSVVYAAYAYLRSLGVTSPKFVNRLLIVGPLSSFKAWEEEYTDIFSQPPSAKRIAGVLSPEERRAYLRGHTPQSSACEITLTTYQTLANHKDDFLAYLEAESHRTMMVLDEAHYIKSDDGVWASVALELSTHAKSRVVLTGTPAPNGYEDLSNLFKFIYPTRDLLGFTQAGLKAMSLGRMPLDATIRLKEKIRPFYTRIRKRDLNLPETRHTLVNVPMSNAHKQIYDFLEDTYIPQMAKDNVGIADLLSKARLVRLRQAATNPSLLMKPLEEEGFTTLRSDSFTVSDSYIFQLIEQFDPKHDLRKLAKLRDLITGDLRDRQKLLIWSIFVSNLHMIKEYVQDLFDYSELIYGATPIDDVSDSAEAFDLETREKIIDRFRNGNERSVLIANPQAIGESISLHKACHTAIYFDRDFNAGRFIQSKDRIHRYGLQQRQVTDYFYMTVGGTVETAIDRRLSEKEQRLSELIDSDEVPLFRIVLGDEEEHDDIRAIIADYEDRKRSG